MSHFDVTQVKRIPIADVLGALGVPVKKDGDRLVACCPFHDDSTPSFVVDPKKNLWKCHGPCDVGGSVIDLVMRKESLPFVEALRWLAGRFGIAEEATEKPRARAKVAEYHYVDAAGAAVYTIERWEPGKNGRPKDFVQRRGDGSFKKSEQQILYRLPLLAERPHDIVFVVEGEKAVDALIRRGLVATTAAGGTGAWRTWTKDFAAPLAGRRCVVVPDNDEGGGKLAKAIAGALQAAGASEVRWLELDGPAKAGADDWLDVVGRDAAQLLDLAAKAPLASADAQWRSGLLRTATGEIRPTVGNALSILEHADAFRGAFWFHERELAVYTDRALPWDKAGTKVPRQVTDDDPVFGAAWCETEMRAAVSAEAFGKALWALARQRRRDPLVDYLRGLKWDGKPRAERWLIDHAGATDNAFVRAASKAWLISAVARALDPGCKVDHVLVLEGEQGLRKSSLLAALAGAGGFADNIPDVDSKDTALILGRTWILELAELESMRKSEVTQMNAFVTRTHDVFRPPYDRTTLVVPRRCVFAATTNELEYLRDPTGARRWWPVRVGRVIDFDELVRQRDQLWAEAVARFVKKEPWWLTDAATIALQKEETAEREASDPWEAKLSERLEGQAWTTIPECLAFMGLDSARQNEAEAKRVGKILRRLEWKKSRRRMGTRREVRFYPPGGAPPDDPPVHRGGGGGQTVDTRWTENGGVQTPPSTVSTVSTVVSHAGAGARAHVQQGIDFSARLSPKSSENTVDTVDTVDNPQQNAAKPVHRPVHRPASGVEDGGQRDVSPAEAAIFQAQADALWDDGDADER